MCDGQRIGVDYNISSSSSLVEGACNCNGWVDGKVSSWGNKSKKEWSSSGNGSSGSSLGGSLNTSSDCSTHWESRGGNPITGGCGLCCPCVEGAGNID